MSYTSQVKRVTVKNWLHPSIPLSALQDQFAFHPTGSTTCALVTLFHHVTHMLEKIFMFIACLLISVRLLMLLTIKCSFIKSMLLLCQQIQFCNWIVSFLISHQQMCIVNGFCSLVSDITLGIIQGSGIGPTLYLVKLQ